ncbi:Gfo/Idh/MocA family oxidoreductase [Kutzneria viridogrisea]|uniref:Uncharacterized protein n=2 Tax=Kutzneria TaxID=43356 RepID=W5WNC6_9PSEU|nr:Gfo/Idh/MocA family oxidoreductase [Kutzneria albida]AHH99649.1 hypothetical protein KALB_6289 [Kutzneria albida DSM 43870]MBA8924825.1 virulence factor [Kutzneria viridogrisea]
MKVGCIGLGDIAEKAYLPVLTTIAGVEPHLHSRTAATVRRVGDTHRIPELHRHSTLDSLLSAGLDAAFVHSPTSTHAEIVTHLLEAGVPTYVDKPLSDELAACERLVQLAQRRGVSLMVGFNRRYAPGYAQCLDHPRDLILLRKNRVNLPERARSFAYDDFIHVVDTLRFLAPGEVEHVDVRTRVRDGLLDHAVLHLSGDGFTAIGTMNRRGGVAEEVLEVSGGDRTRRVVNLAEVVDSGVPHRRGDWTPVARQRGIEQIVLAFLEAVRAGTLLDAEDALRTHELCERLVRAA